MNVEQMVGKRVFIETVTYFYIGKLEAVTYIHYVISEASKVFETGALAGLTTDYDTHANAEKFRKDALILVERHACTMISEL